MAENAYNRRENWSQEQIKCLLDEIEKRKKVIRGNFDQNITMKSKELAWAEVANAVNATFTIPLSIKYHSFVYYIS